MLVKKEEVMLVSADLKGSQSRRLRVSQLGSVGFDKDTTASAATLRRMHS